MRPQHSSPWNIGPPSMGLRQWPRSMRSLRMEDCGRLGLDAAATCENRREEASWKGGVEFLVSFAQGFINGVFSFFYRATKEEINLDSSWIDGKKEGNGNWEENRAKDRGGCYRSGPSRLLFSSSSREGNFYKWRCLLFLSLVFSRDYRK